MSRLRKKLREEKGSMTIEFLMVFPYYLFFFLLLWQAVASGITVMKAQSAVNEAAKLYAIKEDVGQSKTLAAAEVGNNDIMEYRDLNVYSQPDGSFEAVLDVRHGLVFVPEKWRSKASVEFKHKAIGRVIK
jgi:hypothetical protein